MRTGLSILFLLAATIAPAAAHSSFSPNAAAPVSASFANEHAPAHIELPSADSFLYRHARREDTQGLTLDTDRMSAPPTAVSSGPSINIGSFHAEIGGTGTHAHLAHYTLEGVQVMGGSVSGSIDGKSARIAIDW
jgi:hypothetical protein